jgi:hypothetical protein
LPVSESFSAAVQSARVSFAISRRANSAGSTAITP